MKIVLFGTGSAAETIKNQINEAVVNIATVSDNNEDKWGTSWYGYKIIAPENLHEIDYDYILICSMYTSEIIESLLELGIKKEKIVPFFDNVDWQKKFVEQANLEKKIRKVIFPQKNSRKIALLSRRNSGCNCLALYRNIPEVIKQNFTVELIDLEGYRRSWREYEIVLTTHMESRNYKSPLNIETWHGFPLKALGSVVKNTDDLGNVDRGIDYILSYSNLYSFIMSSSYNISMEKFITTGMPRNDLLNSSNARTSLSLLIGKEITNQRIIYYIPTFRRRVGMQYIEGDNISTYVNELEILDQFLERKQTILLVKKHPFDADLSIEESYNNIFFVSDEDYKNMDIDLYETLDGSDMLITDYSSIYYDYLLLNKPIIFWTKDQQTYNDNRGFMFDNPETMMPGPNVKNVEELIDSVKRFLNDKEWYASERTNIKKLVHKYDDFKSSERVWDFILSIYKQEITK